MIPATPTPGATPAEVESRREYKLKLYDRLLATVSVLGLISSGLWSVMAYLDQNRNSFELRERELQLTIYREKKEVYYPLCDNAAAIVSCKSYQEAKPYVMDYLKMYYGKAHLVFIDQGVNDKKIAFKKRMMIWANDPNVGPPPDDLTQLAIDLTDACRESLDPRKVLRPVSGATR